MTEYFDVDPGHVAGYGRLCGEVALDTYRIGRYLAAEASAAYGFDGVLMGLIAPIVDEYATAADQRVRSRGWALHDTDTELRNTAWTYLGTDRPERFTMLEDPIGRGAYRVEVDHPGLVSYPHETVEGELSVPGLEDARFEKLMEEHAGDTLGTIDMIVKTVTGLIPGVAEYSITEEITNELTGNWMVLEQKADALDHAADAAESAAAGLGSTLSTVDAHWDGGAATAFTPYISGLTTALAYEGPLNRVVAFAYRTVAGLIAELAGMVVELISTGVEMIRKYAAGFGGRLADMGWDLLSDGKPPWEAAKEDWEAAKVFFDNAKLVVQEIHQLPEDLQALVDATKSPTAAADYSLDMAITELGEREDLPEGTADNLSLGIDFSTQVGPELADLAADADDFAHAPDHGFDAGENLRRAG